MHGAEEEKVKQEGISFLSLTPYFTTGEIKCTNLKHTAPWVTTHVNTHVTSIQTKIRTVPLPGKFLMPFSSQDLPPQLTHSDLCHHWSVLSFKAEYESFFLASFTRHNDFIEHISISNYISSLSIPMNEYTSLSNLLSMGHLGLFPVWG